MKISLVTFVIAGLPVPLLAQSIPTSSNLPIVIIKTNGQTIVDEPKIMADMGIIYNGPGNRNQLTDSLNHYNGKIGIEFRGNTSQNSPKKPYGLETRKADGSNLNVSLLGMPVENDWVLFNTYDDETFMRDVLTHALARNAGHYSPRTVFVELFVSSNDSFEYEDYKGIYVLMEKIKQDKNRVDISELEYKDSTGNALTGGYIVKIDHHAGTPGPYWNSQYPNECGDFRTDFELHEPADEDIHPAHLVYIKNYLYQFETALSGPAFTDPVQGYRAYADVGSFIDYFLLSELVRSTDAYSFSTYMYKNRDSKGGKLVMGPMWDYNASMGNTPYNFCAANDTTGWQYQSQRLCRVDRKQPFWWKRLLDDPAYVAQLQARWTTLRNGVLNLGTIMAMIQQNRDLVSEAQPRDYERWNVVGDHGTFDEEMDFLRDWLRNRLAWMDRNVPQLGNYVQVSALTPPPITCESPVSLSAYTGKQLAYEWKLNGDPVPGGVNSTIVAYKPGTYSVAVTLAGDCYTETLAIDPISRIVKSVQNGDWNQSSTWSCQTVPTSLDAVVIQQNHAVNIPPSVQVSAASVSLETNARINQQINASLLLGH
ncbi:CotH kinase family protein [Salmonirosea aquatica]|uniref:Spore coat protein CotH n=1 Tax=Salmonirosea aquatica TaxID=2654236 RepID=A0A7C9B7H3_9BACT|nr:spore coat protein CotH [Cytophagaceae bacterium SJW1-29]